MLASLLLLTLFLPAAPSGAQEAARATAPAAGACAVSTAQGVKQEAAPASDAISGIRFSVKRRDGSPLARKRFFLLDKSVAEAAGIDWAGAPRRADYLEGASAELRGWLGRHDCDTLYCPEYGAEFESAVREVPEFRRAYEAGLKKYGSPKVALRWLAVNFPLKKLRTEYYKKKKAWLDTAARRAGSLRSVMTDENGTAYFTGVGLRQYYISNLIPLEDGGVLWDCAVSVPPPIPRQLHSVSVTLTYPEPAAAPR